jgi:hypothetical protein
MAEKSQRNRPQSDMKEIILPPVWCASICRNATNDICVEHCAIKRDCSGFEPKDFNFTDMPRFPRTNGKTKEEKFAIVAIYLAKVVDYLKGVEDYGTYYVRRQNLHNTGSGRLSQNLQVEDLLPGIQEANTPPENREECPD